MAKGDIGNALGGPFRVPALESIPPEAQLINAIVEAGLEAPSDIFIDGRIHRFSGDGKREKAAWYIAYPDGVPAGAFGNWKTGFMEKWCANIGRELSFSERMQRDKRYAEAKAIREAEREKLAESIAETASIIWDNCPDAPSDHPYLMKKGVKAHGIKVTGDGRLVLPLYDADGKLVTLQYIDKKGVKLYHNGGPAGGRYWVLGNVNKTIYLAEGFATAASIHEATGDAVYLAYSAGNLINVAGIIREKHGPTADVVIVADNDESGTGQKAASETAQRWGMRVVIPPIIGDANDYVQSGHDLLALLKPKLSSDWLISADVFSSKPQPINWLIKKWVQSNALLMVHGPSGGGKTFVVLNWCLLIASDINNWSGYPVKSGNVVYLAGEGHWGLKARIAAWKHYHHIHKTNMWLSKCGCELNTPTGYQMVVDHVRSLPVRPDLIVVDTLHRFLSGDENSSQDAGTMLNACNSLMAEFECSVLLVHHTGVSDEAQHRGRGSSAWRGALDVEISVIKEKNGSTITLQQMKQKDSEVSEPIYLNLQSVAIPGWIDEDGEQVTSAVVVESSEPVKAKKDSKVAGYMKMFQRAWFASGEEMSDDHKPFVSRKAMLDFLVENDGNTEEAAKQMVKPGATGRYIGCLINGEIIEAKDQKGDSGWQVIDNNLISTMLIQSKQNGVRL